MDPNPEDLPILSYALSQVSEPNSKPTSQVSNPSQLFAQMPHLNHAKVLQSMMAAVSDVLRTRTVLRALGDRPDQAAVEAARAKIGQIKSELDDRLEGDCRKDSEREMKICEAVVRLDDMYEAYVAQLRDAEKRLAEIYESGAAGLAAAGEERNEEVDEEVAGILEEASRKEMERVDLSVRQLRFLPEAFGKLHGLVVLDLSNNQFEFIPDSIAGLQKLEELNVSSNLLESLPDSIGSLSNLKILDVSGNKLNALPDSIARCSSLVELDAGFNNITSLPASFGFGLMNLRKLSIFLNKIRTLPPSIGEMRALRYLDAHFNELHGLPHAIGRLPNLEVLNVSSNFSDLTELPETIGDLTNLRELDLSNNQIRVLPATFGKLQNLTKLNLDQNPLVIPPMEVVDKGVEAVKEFMAKRWLDMVAKEEERSMAGVQKQPQTGFMAWGAAWLNSIVSEVSQSVAGYLGGGQASKDPFLDQQL